VKVQRFVDDFGCKGLNTGNKPPATPAEPGSVLDYNKRLKIPLPGKEQTRY
jgi:hypothetical protein